MLFQLQQILIIYLMYQCAQSAITLNNLNLPVYDIHQKEARDQILFNFHTLANSTSAINERHMSKCQEQNDRIEALRQRILNCKGTLNQAIVFVSPSQYPTKYEFNTQHNKSRFSQFLHRTSINKLDMNAQYIVKHDIKELGKEAKLKLKDLDEFILFMFGKLKGKRKTVFEKGISNKKQIDNLGRIPTNINYLDSLTVFNTHINPYKKYEVINNVVKIEKAKKNEVNQLATDDKISQNSLHSFVKTAYMEDEIKLKKTDKEWEEPDWEDNLGLGGIVDMSYSFNDDVAFISQPKKKTVATDTLANKKVESTISQNTDNSSSPSNVKSQNSRAQNQLQTPPNPYYNQSNIPPPPPAPPANLILPPPPPLNLILPSISLPPPINSAPMKPNILPPPLGLPPPILGTPPPISSVVPPPTGNRSALLQQIQNPNPMGRLKRTVTKQYSGVNKLTKANTLPEQGNMASANSAPKNDAGPMDMMQALKQKIMKRFILLHPQRQQQNGQ